MYLKSLTLRGFKSFASATTLAFEPGVTAVVGPNGSGKSNVVDALAWVMGEQGAKTLRGGKMEDVIFAGTAGRPPLGRAEVSLTIDNTDGALPIDYAEVTITRTMFRSGGSEYAINGNTARLLDVQELLSDSGIGREMHVIVGQGQLEAILRATPEERRGFIEEAAGVLKHRKRKEKALRKLEAMGANLTRVSDLAGELRRQLTPLGRQAKVAKRANVIQADLRDSGLRLLADDLVTLQASFESDRAGQAALMAQQSQVSDALTAARDEEARQEARWSEHSPALREAQQTWHELAALRERMVGLATVAGDRARGLSREPAEERSGRDPDELLVEARRMRTQEAELETELAARRQQLAAAVAARTSAESTATSADQEFRAAMRASADRREGLARLTGQVGAARSRLEARTAEAARLAAAESAARQRAAAAAAQFAALEGDVAGLDAGEVNLDSQYEDAARSLSEVDGQIAQLLSLSAELQQRRAAALARESALAAMAVVGDGASELLEAGLPGVIGPLASQIRVQPGLERAVAAALGPLAEALVTDDLQSAGGALRWASDAGRVVLAVGERQPVLRDDWPQPPEGTQYIWDVISGPTDVMAGLGRALASAVLTPGGLDQALDVVGRQPHLLAVTPEGLLVGRGGAIGGSPGPATSLELLADLEATRNDLQRLGHEEQRLRFELAGLQARRTDLAEVAESALAALHESDARMAALAEQLGTLGSAVRAANAEAARLAASLAAAGQARDADERTLAELTQRLDLAADAGTPTDPTPTDRDDAAAVAAEARRAETEARLGVRTAEERVRAISGRAEQLERAAAAERIARDRAEARRQRRTDARNLCEGVADAAGLVLSALESALAAAAAERDAVEAAAAQADAGLREVRARVRQLSNELAELTADVHRDELVAAAQQSQLEALAERAMSEYAVSVETLISEYGPHQLVPPSLAAPGDDVDPAAEPAQPRPYDRCEQEQRFKAAQQGLALLGKVNPLALEEFDALSERHRFLTEQLEDLKRSRKDLLELIRDVDRRVEEVFAAAFADTAAQFEMVFARLFPGGSGQLVLTDPESMLTTGVEVEARPPGKKVKRLSLLSGGERSLTAVAFLVALFKARPSPFYVLDEVEAALDDTNLSRLLDVIEELRADSQLIVITHQKRTMEVADALYGISMRGDGVSAVISQRLRDRVG